MKKLKLKYSSSKWSETEKEVAEIIRDLYRVCLLSSIPFSWRCTRKRSSVQNKVSPSPYKCICTFNGGSIVLKGEASSPPTPFLIPVSESKEKIKHSKIKISLVKEKKSSLKTIEDYCTKKNKTIEDLTENRTLLNQEIEKVKKYHDQLKIFNLNLKLKKQKLLCKSKLENQQKVQLDHEANGLVKTSESTAQDKEKQNQLQNNGSFSTELGQNINSNNMDPTSTNLPLKESHETRENRAIAAVQARERRLNILRLKKRAQRENRSRKN